MDNQHHHHSHDHTLTGLPDYTLDLDHHHNHSSASSTHIHHQHEHEHDHNDLEHDASLAAEYFANTEDDGTGAGGGDLSLGDATLVAAGVPFLPDEEIPPQSQTPASRPRKRKLQLACHFCRRRKLKCDGVHPTCENCLKRNEICNWDEAVRRRGPGKRTKALRDKAADEAAAAGMHEATGLDSSAFSVGGGDDTASSVADTNAALIAAVTAAAAEGNAAGMNDFGTDHLGEGLYGDENGHEGHISPLPTGTPISSSSAALLAHAIPNHQSKPPPSQSKDPNIDPSLVDLSQNPATLAEVSSPKLPSSTTTQSQPTQHIYQPPQLPRKLPGVGVGVNVQAPNFGQIQNSTVNNGSTNADLLDLGTDDLTGENASVVDPNTEDVLEWSKGYNFSTWPDLDLGSGGREL